MKYIAGKTASLHPDQGRLTRGFDITIQEGDVRLAIEVRSVGDHCEFAKPGPQPRPALSMNVPFVSHPVADQLRYCDHFQFMLSAEVDKVGHSGHRSVIFNNFENHSRRC